MNVNYQIILQEEIEKIKENNIVPRLLLHSCCGPCSSYVLEYLSKYFFVTVFYFNPCIYPYEEYLKRKENQMKIINEMPFENTVDIIDCDYDYNYYLDYIKGLENEPEGGKRCHKCFYLRLENTVIKAKELKYDYFATTLSVSPYKNARILNEIGKNLQDEYGVKYLFSDFKKKNGYKRSIELSKEYDLYRQHYCGCEFSLEKEL